MPQPHTWLEEIVETLKELGGHGYYKDIYDRILERNVMNFQSNPSWQASIRGTIERFSSDSSIYGDKADVFHSTDGIGKGHWELRDFEPTGNNVDITNDDSGFAEGKKKLREHILRERNYRVISLKKEKFKQEHGKLYCEICGFDFENRYGEIGKDFIEGHHIIPVSEIPENYKTKVDDIVLVCSNCHSMLHRKRPWLKREQLHALLR